VIAFASGGALETVTEQTGLFFYDQKVDSLCGAVREMERIWMNFTPEAFQLQAERFGRKIHKNQMARAIEYGYKQWKDGI